MYSGQQCFPGIIGINFNIVPDAVCGPKADNAACFKQFVIYNSFQQNLGIVIKFFGFDANVLIIEYFWETAAQLPCMEKRRPINIWHKLFQRECFKNFGARKFRLYSNITIQTDLEFLPPRLFNAYKTLIRFLIQMRF